MTGNSNQNILIIITLVTSQAEIPTGNYLSDSDSWLKYQKAPLFLLADSSRKLSLDSQEIKTNSSVPITHSLLKEQANLRIYFIWNGRKNSKR